MPTDKYGNQLSWKEYGKRWREGIENITPLQQAKIQYQNTWIIIFGLAAGVVFSFMRAKDFWWMVIILVGALVNTVMVQIANYQKYKILKNIDKELKGAKQQDVRRD